MKRVGMEADYQVGTGIIRLTIIIGNAQIGVSNVMLDGKSIAKGTITDQEIGDGPKLVGRKVTTKTVVTDVNDSTNRTNVKYLLTGGKIDQEYNLSAIVDEDGDSVVYSTGFRFTE